jgi:Peptidase S46
MMRLLRSAIVALLLVPAVLAAQGGMWLPLHLKLNNEREMKSLGLKLSADDLYHPQKPSVMDAICQFDGGCTGEIISPQGLLLTNHHCGFDAIQSHSTLEHNYVDDGFWAKDKASELPCPGVTAMFVRRIEDVTALAVRGITIEMSEADRQAQIDANLAQVKKNASYALKRGEEILIRPFYNGNQYFMYITVTYKDVRLVGAPPSSIGKFGADTDNWVWPRHTGDFSMFRVYMSRDSQPVAYSADNIPLAPRHYLPISLDGVKEGDFTMVYGFPGRTDEYLTAAAVEQTTNVLNPARVAVRDRTLKILDGYMRRDPDIKIAYIARQASIANSWKKWLGEMQGLRTYGALDKKRTYEKEFTRRVELSPDWKPIYGNLLPRLEANYQTIQPYALTRDYYMEVFVRNCELMGRVASMDSWINSYKSGGPGTFSGKITAQREALDGFYKDFRLPVDRDVFAALMEIYAREVRDEWGAAVVKAEVAKYNGSYSAWAEDLYSKSILADRQKMMPLLDKGIADLHKALDTDPAVVFWRAVTADYQAKVVPKLQETQPLINAMQRQYMAAQMVVFKEKRFFPDANSTLRLTYGQVRGFRPRDGIVYDHRTYLDGVMEKYVPGDYEFDVPQRLRELYQAKDFGPYAMPDGRMPVAFLGSNHTTGGNSGSPALNARGQLVGLNFDRVWEGTMSDLNYDPTVCRNIMVDARYILFVVDKYAGAKHLVDEMTIVQKKKGKR